MVRTQATLLLNLMNSLTVQNKVPFNTTYFLLHATEFSEQNASIFRDHLDSNIRGTNTFLNSNFLTRVTVTYLRNTVQYAVPYEVLTSEYGRFNELYKFVYLRQEFNCHLQVCTEPILQFYMIFRQEDRKFHQVQEPGYVLPCEPWKQSQGDKAVTISLQDIPLPNSRRLSHGINPLNTKCRLLYLKTQFIPRSKHFSSWL
jgi:hypothetical protein